MTVEIHYDIILSDMKVQNFQICISDWLLFSYLTT